MTISQNEHVPRMTSNLYLSRVTFAIDYGPARAGPLYKIRI